MTLEYLKNNLRGLRESLTEMTHLQCDDSLIKDNCSGYLQDSSFNGTSLPAGVVLDPNKGLYWMTDKVFVPCITFLKKSLINEFHDTAGNLDAKRAYSVILQTLYWPNLWKDDWSFVKSCSNCLRIKTRTDEPYGSSMPLHVLIRPWDLVSMDFITNLPNVDGYDAIFIVVCTLFKMKRFIPWY